MKKKYRLGELHERHETGLGSISPAPLNRLTVVFLAPLRDLLNSAEGFPQQIFKAHSLAVYRPYRVFRSSLGASQVDKGRYRVFLDW